ncbi:MAG: hypothetical protein AUJ51_06425 [Elusimicrobia bacterium CG1_02_56_21]|nr:MAG: hypothetical protein AUJ51_06425 [Elusimicrobia bacterium CG1_02_56_21]
MAKILVVEDNENNTTLVRDILTLHGHEIIEAKNGEEGVKMAREAKPDLILMDIQMPVMDGFTAAKALRADPATKDIKIVGVTSYAMKGDKEKVLAAGFDLYIAKPINTRELPAQIKELLAKK